MSATKKNISKERRNAGNKSADDLLHEARRFLTEDMNTVIDALLDNNAFLGHKKIRITKQFKNWLKRNRRRMELLAQ